jgi:hypothetical protein
MQDLEQSIRERAYHLWIADGCRDGRADTHTPAGCTARSLGEIFLEVSPV